MLSCDLQELIPGQYTLDEESGGHTDPSNSCPIGSALSLYFADGTKVKVSLSPNETTSDLLEKEEVKDHLSSSAARVWLIDSLGNGTVDPLPNYEKHL